MEWMDFFGFSCAVSRLRARIELYPYLGQKGDLKLFVSSAPFYLEELASVKTGASYKTKAYYAEVIDDCLNLVSKFEAMGPADNASSLEASLLRANLVLEIDRLYGAPANLTSY